MAVKKIGKALFRIEPSFGFISCGVYGLDKSFGSYGWKVDHKKVGPRPHGYCTPEVNSYTARVKEYLETFLQTIMTESDASPIRLGAKKQSFTDSIGNLDYCIYKGHIYKLDRPNYSDEELILQIMDLEDEERRKFERLRNKFSKAEEEEKQGKRPAVPEDVRIAVWRRDEGKCVKCSSRENLEYDHIIPISKGGSNTVRNIELLCEVCNRSKSDNIR